MERIKKLEEEIASTEKGLEQLVQELFSLQKAAESDLSANTALSKVFGDRHVMESKSILELQIASTRKAIKEFESELIKKKSELASLTDETK